MADAKSNSNTKVDNSPDKSGSGNRNIIIVVIAVIVIIIIAAAILGNSTAPSSQNSSSVGQQASFNVTSYGTTVPQTNSSNSTSGQILLASSQYAQIAHLIYSPNQTSVKYEAAGFDINITDLFSGAVNVTFSKLGNAGLNSTFTVPKGDSLYYLDASLGDDSPPTGEYSLSDDGVILVNSSGYIVGNVLTP